MPVLGIETSCDETGVALSDDGNIIAADVATQQIHARWGGVVPELASRLHQRTLARMVTEILEDTGLALEDLNGVAATRGPGLIGALLVGTSYAKGLSVGLGIPYVGVNHLEGHIWAAEASGAEIPVPALALLISGGHTELLRIDGFGQYSYLGGTLDDAVGEAFDKVGGLLGIRYPAGPVLAKLAEKGNPEAFRFPVATTGNRLDFSYSGLKTAVVRQVNHLRTSGDSGWESDIAASFESAAIEQLVRRVNHALENELYRSVLLAGGVAANLRLRERMSVIADKQGIRLVIPPVEWCTDNGAMIAYLGERLLADRGGDPLTLQADPNLQLVNREDIGK